MSKWLNPETGEFLNENSSIRDLAELRKVYLMKVKELDGYAKDITELLRPHFEEAYEMGDKEFADYWTLSISAPRFNIKSFQAEADAETQNKHSELKEQLKEIEDKYKKPGNVYLKFPRHG